MTNIEKFLCGFAKMLQEKWQVDIQLKARDSVDGVPIAVHKLVLAARSKVFKTMFESDEFKGSGEELKTVTLSDMDQEALEAFVEFIYSDGSLSTENLKLHVAPLYIAAYKYEIPHLRDLCTIEIIKNLDTSHALKVLELSQNVYNEILNDAAFLFVSKNLRTICNLDEFSLFVASQPKLTVELIKAAFELM